MERDATLGEGGVPFQTLETERPTMRRDCPSGEVRAKRTGYARLLELLILRRPIMATDYARQKLSSHQISFVECRCHSANRRTTKIVWRPGPDLLN